MTKDEKILPTFFVLGAMKSGTTSIHYYLNQHPDIYMSSLKETNFFSYEWSNMSLDEYASYFEGTTTETAIGEACTSYLHHEEAAERIYAHRPEARLIAILRNPAERAHSHYRQQVRAGKESRSFEKVIQNDSEPYVDVGFYARQLSRYLEFFNRQQLRLYRYEAFGRDPERLIIDMFEFVGVDSRFTPDVTQRHRTTARPKNKLLHFMLTRRNPVTHAVKAKLPSYVRRQVIKLRQNNLQPPDKMSTRARRTLIKTYRDDIQKLQRILDEDLTSWLTS